MFRRTILLTVASVITLWGQWPPVQGVPAPGIFPPPQQAFEEVKQQLGLTDAQMQQLRTIMEERDKANQEVYRQIQEKQTELNLLLESGSRDSARIGQLMIDIYTLGKQPSAPNDQWRRRALAVLTSDQRTKLGSLDQALKLSTPAYQAVTLNLLDAPVSDRVIALSGIEPAKP